MTGCATCMCVNPGMIVAACSSARSSSARRSAVSCAVSASIAPRSHSRMSVATWSLRERPVCSRLPASPTRSVSRRSMLRWTSSRSRDHTNSPRAISARICAMPCSIRAKSSAGMIPVAASMRAWASDPAMSTSASRWSKSTDAVNRLTRSVTGSLNRPDQPPASSEAGGGGGWAGRYVGDGHGRLELCLASAAAACRQCLPGIGGPFVSCPAAVPRNGRKREVPRRRPQ